MVRFFSLLLELPHWCLVKPHHFTHHSYNVNFQRETSVCPFVLIEDFDEILLTTNETDVLIKSGIRRQIFHSDKFQ